MLYSATLDIANKKKHSLVSNTLVNYELPIKRLRVTIHLERHETHVYNFVNIMHLT